MKKNVVGIVLGFLVGSSLLAWAVGPVPFEGILLRNQGEVRFQEQNANGGNYIALKAPSSIASNLICTLEDDSTPFDGCVSGGGGSIAINGATVTDPDFIDGHIEFDVTGSDVTATIGAGGVDAITDLDAAIRSGADAKVVTGTPGSTDECAKWNVDGDLVSAGAACGASGGGGKPWEKFTANQAFLPAASYATHDTRNTHPVLDFDAAADECAYFGGFLASTYAGGGLNVVLAWMATSATTGATGWLVAIEAHPDDALDLDADSFAADNSASATTASVAGEVQYTTIAFTDGADMDSLAAGESYRLRVCRDGNGSVVTDDMAGDAELYKLVVLEP